MAKYVVVFSCFYCSSPVFPLCPLWIKPRTCEIMHCNGFPSKQRRDTTDGSMATGQTDWKHAGKFIPKERQSQLRWTDQRGTNPAVIRNISIINSNPLSNPNTKANRYLWECLRVNFLLAALTTNNKAISGRTHKNVRRLIDSHMLCNSYPTLAPSISCWILPGWLLQH